VSSSRLVLARHGLTDANVRHVLDTRPPGPPLNEIGRVQALALAEELAGWRLRAVIASTALRAQQTARPVSARHGLPIDVVDGFQEVFVGDLELRSDEAALQAFRQVGQRWRAGDLTAALPGGESGADVQRRFLTGLDTVREQYPDGDVLLVSHGAAIRLAAGALLGDSVETEYVPNTGRVVLAADPGSPTGWRLESWDDAPPLPGDVTAGGSA
jgi:probable phosphoglycerate mutase